MLNIVLWILGLGWSAWTYFHSRRVQRNESALQRVESETEIAKLGSRCRKRIAGLEYANRLLLLGVVFLGASLVLVAAIAIARSKASL